MAAFSMAAVIEAAEPDPDIWPCWRGPRRDGMLSPRPWPSRLQGDALSRRWRVTLGPGYSGPIVGFGKVFVTETEDETFERVRAFDRGTGKEIWSARWEGAMKVAFFAASNGSWIRATPALDGDRLYVAGMRDRLVCLDAPSGKIVWNVDCMERFGSPLPAFGFVSSPLVLGDAVYVQAGASFLKLDKRTGETIWRTLADDGGMYGSAFSSPIAARIRDVDQIVVQTRRDLAGVDPASGKVLWSQAVPAFQGMNILTPTVFEDAVFTSSYGGGSFLFRIGKDGDAYRVSEAWKARTQGYMCSPLLIEGNLYIHLRDRRFACIDWKTGKTRWTSSERFGKYMSLVGQGDRILALDERGILLLIAADPERFVLLDSRKVSEESTWAHLGVSGDALFVRELHAIAAFAWTESGAPPAAGDAGPARAP
ncbi:MAG: PQQ-binding-like beta-propeller repeat protein [Planctomycetes bacterium]|nr:PQQ-binding-like beta-propeller repeat protein [Planctomycetota bacterium]